jgi:hypothetical protein
METNTLRSEINVDLEALLNEPIRACETVDSAPAILEGDRQLAGEER